ncbi:hypothetical protein [Alteromonas sediminis]|uniref:COG3904 family protein n=1 Tax=Alteromonas sediminis TaxID=2259342 RepID=UPI00140485E2|nr:hypothetical protein [Alteromonas sediminis]
MTDKQPDFTTYSLRELEDALSHINKDAYPERVEIIIQEIASRESDFSAQEDEFIPIKEQLHPNWFIRYWKGQVSLPMSYWGVGLATVMLIYAISYLVERGIEASTDTWQLGAYIIVLYVFIITTVVWQSVGLFRTARKHPLRTGDSGWATVAIFMLGIGLVSFTFEMYRTGVPIIKGGIQLLINNNKYPATEFRVINEGKDLELIGRIELGSDKRLNEQLTINPKITRIHLHSEGGRLVAANRMADTIKQHNLDTYVKAECASACTLLYLAGSNRLLATTGKLKFHAPGFGGLSAHNVEELGSALQSAYERTNMPEWFIKKIMQTPNESLWIPTQEELLKAKVVTEIVNPDEYPLSGLGPESAITVEGVESGLLTQDYMQAMKEYDTEAYQRAVEININGMLAGKSRNQISREFQDLLYVERLPIYLRIGSDEAVVQYWLSQIDHMKELRNDFPLACASFAFPGDIPSEKHYGNEGVISAEQEAKDLAAIEALIRSINAQPPNIDKATQKGLVKEVLSKLKDRNADFVNVVASAKDFVDKPSLLCDASIALNEGFVSFDIKTSGQLLRSFSLLE